MVRNKLKMVRMSVFTLEYYTFWITQFLCFLIYDKNTGLNKAKITIKNSDNKGISFLCKPQKCFSSDHYSLKMWHKVIDFRFF